jgi:hypothetical protein
MEVKRFSSGGFVVRKIKIRPSRLTFSAWYDAHGNFLDVEAFTEGGKIFAPFTAKRAKGPIGRELKLIGFRHSGLLQWARGE